MNKKAAVAQLWSILRKVDEAHLVLKHWPKKLIGLGLNTTLIWTWTFEAAHKNGSQVSVFDLRKGSSKVKRGSQEKYDLGLEEKTPSGCPLLQSGKD